jgi:hypothetical protein
MHHSFDDIDCIYLNVYLLDCILHKHLVVDFLSGHLWCKSLAVSNECDESSAEESESKQKILNRVRNFNNMGWRLPCDLSM